MLHFVFKIYCFDPQSDMGLRFQFLSGDINWDEMFLNLEPYSENLLNHKLFTNFKRDDKKEQQKKFLEDGREKPMSFAVRRSSCQHCMAEGVNKNLDNIE
eukprot:snap_masked-scaffold_2-processed-gene-10.31-mRNA-1 protein AED:1.00 eAED:1.00 QI:0/-1/0/0/-1/1/1/0/99